MRQLNKFFFCSFCCMSFSFSWTKMGERKEWEIKAYLNYTELWAWRNREANWNALCSRVGHKFVVESRKYEFRSLCEFAMKTHFCRVFRSTYFLSHHVRPFFSLSLFHSLSTPLSISLSLSLSLTLSLPLTDSLILSAVVFCHTFFFVWRETFYLFSSVLCLDVICMCMYWVHHFSLP